DVMPAWATSPTAERRAGGISAYQGSVSSRRWMVAVAKSPEIRRSQASVAALSIDAGDDPVTPGSAISAGVSARAGVDVVQVVLRDRLCDQRTVDLTLVCEALQSANHHRGAIDLEEATSSRTGISKTEPVCTQRVVAAGNPLTD